MTLKTGRAVAALMIVLAVLAVAACATGGRVQIVTGEALDALGKQFVETGALYDRLLVAKRITPEEYGAWAAFAPRFQTSYRQAVAAWNSGQGDATTDTVILLKNNLRDFLLFAAERDN